MFDAWREFRRGKGKKSDVARFEFNVEDNIFKLREELLAGLYLPAPYEAFYVKDPKLRHIHKACVRDRVVHQAIFRVLLPIFDKHFIFDSYSSRNGKGTHAGVKRLENFIRKASANWTQHAWCLKCDVRKFFDSIDHRILLGLIRARVSDERAMKLIEILVRGFEKSPGKGLPLGNVTSQLFANVYMNEFDRFVKHVLKAKYYARYCDDFVIVCRKKVVLTSYIQSIYVLLSTRLGLQLHPTKIHIRKVRQGIDFLGQVVLPYRNVLRTNTKRRMFRMANEKNIASYLGMLSHCRGERTKVALNQKIDKASG